MGQQMCAARERERKRERSVKSSFTVQVENLAQWWTALQNGTKQEKRYETKQYERKHTKNGSWKKKKSITEPCVLPKFIQFTRIVCNDDDSHLVCVWLGRALHKSASCIQTRNDMERVEFWTAHKNTMCKSIDCPPPPIPRKHWSQLKGRFLI